MADFRAFGTVLSENRQPNGELISEAREAIVSASIAGKSTAELVDAFGAANRGVINKIIHKFHSNHTTQTAPRNAGHYEKTFRAERRLCFLAAKYPEYS